MLHTTVLLEVDGLQQTQFFTMQSGGAAPPVSPGRLGPRAIHHPVRRTPSPNAGVLPSLVSMSDVATPCIGLPPPRQCIVVQEVMKEADQCRQLALHRRP